jgi:branched-chain amino acid transport system ATP-binding protein
MNPAKEPSRLAATGIGKRFGALQVLDGIDFAMTSDEAIGVVGPNGAGKSTLMAVLSGALTPSAGRIVLDGTDVTGQPATLRSSRGLVRTHQIPKPFAGLTVFENVLVGATHAGRAAGRSAHVTALEALDMAELSALANRPAESLGLLDRKRLELARALATGPKLLLLDEIGGGLTDGEAQELVAIIKGLRGRGIGIVWIEHIVHILLQVAERLICMDAGRIIADGEPRAVMSDPQVVRAYLGGV